MPQSKCWCDGVYLEEIAWRRAEHLQYFVVARVLTEFEECLAEQLENVVGRYVCGDSGEFHEVGFVRVGLVGYVMNTLCEAKQYSMSRTANDVDLRRTKSF